MTLTTLLFSGDNLGPKNDSTTLAKIVYIRIVITLLATCIVKTRMRIPPYFEFVQNNPLSLSSSRISPEMSTLLGTNKKIPFPTFCMFPFNA